MCNVMLRKKYAREVQGHMLCIDASGNRKEGRRATSKAEVRPGVVQSLRRMMHDA